MSTGFHVFIQCVTWGGPGPQTDKHLPPSTFTGKFLRNADIQGVGVFLVICSMTARYFFVSRVTDLVTIPDPASLDQVSISASVIDQCPFGKISIVKKSNS